MIFLQTTVFVRIFLWICSDDNKCMDDDDKCVTMIANLCCLLRHANSQMHINMIRDVPAVKIINKHSVVALY